MTREDIITAAFRVWGRDLYQSTSLTQLAGDLGVTKPALYRHFPHKKALLDGMYERFFDEYAASIKADYDRALAADNPAEGLVILGRAIARYYCLNSDAFLFALARVYGIRNNGVMAAELARRGVDMEKMCAPAYFRCPGAEEEASYPSLVQLVIGTLMFWIGFSHMLRFNKGVNDDRGSKIPTINNNEDWHTAPLTEETVEAAVASVEAAIVSGLGFNKDRIDGLNYQQLEERIAGLIPGDIEDDSLYRAVAGAVAEAGPWDVSMEMVARRSGRSKSGLYVHFKNRQDMIRRFFRTEYERIVASAAAGKTKSTAPEEQLYLAIISIADYLRARPEILLAFDRIRTRKPDLGHQEEPPAFSQAFAGINIDPLDVRCSWAGTDAGLVRERISQWILFLIVNVLMRWSEEAPPPPPSSGGNGEPEAQDPPGQDCRSRFTAVPNSSFRILYRFIVLGIRGFGNALCQKAFSGTEGVDQWY